MTTNKSILQKYEEMIENGSLDRKPVNLSRVEAYDLEINDEVSCYYCGPQKTYKRGEAYLCGPEHGPCDGNANYICKDHLETGTEIIKLKRIKKYKHRNKAWSYVAAQNGSRLEVKAGDLVVGGDGSLHRLIDNNSPTAMLGMWKIKPPNPELPYAILITGWNRNTRRYKSQVYWTNYLEGDRAYEEK
jgi:hypothetical protein